MENLSFIRPNNNNSNGRASSSLTQRSSATSPKIYLTVSSLIQKRVDRRLVINWEGIDIDESADDGPAVTITLYSHSSPVQSITINTPSGSITTDTQYPHIATPFIELDSNLNSTSSSPHCSPFRIILSSPNLNLTSCLALYPTWMTTLAPIIGNTPLSLLLIPGTHDSGAYDKSLTINYVNTYVHLYQFKSLKEVLK